jgi:hypothetical protein
MGVLVLIIIGFFSYYFYIYQEDKRNNFKVINTSQSITALKQSDKSLEYLYTIKNESNQDYELNFTSGNEIDVEIRATSEPLNIENKTITVDYNNKKKHKKLFKKGDTWKYNIKINTDLLHKGEYQLSAKFIPSNVITQNKTDIYIKKE